MPERSLHEHGFCFAGNCVMIEGMKRILMIATGGTIACKPNRSGRLSPKITSSELLEYVPELAQICEVEARQLYNIDSTNMGPAQWPGIVNMIRENWGMYDGFVITHGTDTMAYTAAALSYMIQKPACPIVLTGSQKSIYSRDTDARKNLLQAFRYAAADGAFGVQIVFDGHVILGTRARKVRSKSYNAFSSIDYPDTAVFRGDHLIRYLDAPAQRPPMRFYTELDPAVFVLRLIPGVTAGIFDYLKEHYDALIIEGFGVGGLPDSGNGALLKALSAWSAAGKIAVFSTQVQHEGSDLEIYEVGRGALELPGVYDAHDMTPEAIVTKLMWALGQTRDQAEAGKLFTEEVSHDVCE